MDNGKKAPVVKIQGRQVTLTPCSGLLAVGLTRTAEEMQAMDGAQSLALGAAALAACWPEDVSWPVRLRPRPWDPGMRVDRYGQQVFDALVAGKVPTAQVMRACNVALNWAWQSGIVADELQAAEDFSGAPGEVD